MDKISISSAIAAIRSCTCRDHRQWRMILLIWIPFALPLAEFARGEELVIESALLRLTHQIEVPARAQGVLSSMDAVEGDSVKRGAIVAMVDDSEAKLLQNRAETELQLQKEKATNDISIRTAQKAIAFHRAESERLERAARDLPGSVSASEAEQLKFQAVQAELELEEAQTEHRMDQQTLGLKNIEVALSKHNVDVRKIIAPSDGVVVEVLRQPGEWVEPGEKVLRIVQIDRLRAEGLVDVRKLPPNIVGAPVSVTINLPTKGETTFSGKVVFVSPEVNPVNGQTRVWAEIGNKEGLLRPGLRPRMTIQLPAAASQTQAARRIQP